MTEHRRHCSVQKESLTQIHVKMLMGKSVTPSVEAFDTFTSTCRQDSDDEKQFRSGTSGRTRQCTATVHRRLRHAQRVEGRRVHSAKQLPRAARGRSFRRSWTRRRCASAQAAQAWQTTDWLRSHADQSSNRRVTRSRRADRPAQGQAATAAETRETSDTGTLRRVEPATRRAVAGIAPGARRKELRMLGAVRRSGPRREVTQSARRVPHVALAQDERTDGRVPLARERSSESHGVPLRAAHGVS